MNLSFLRKTFGTCVCMLLAQGMMAATHYVVAPGTQGVIPTPPYLTPETAGTDIVEVVSIAMTNVVPRLVLVGDGTYYPTNSVTATNLTLRSVNGRDTTIVDGRDNPNRGFFFISSTLDGFTVTNHNVTASAGTGAGVYGEALTLINCLIAGNTADAKGGGCHLGSSSASTITNCIFQGNVVRLWGGGLYTSGVPDLEIVACRFENNETFGESTYGGGAMVHYSRGALVTNCQFVGNHATSGGGVSAPYNKGIFTLSHCTMSSNTGVNGGGLFTDNNTTAAKVIVDSCAITDNTARRGGGVAGGNLRNSLIARNHARDEGGGYYSRESDDVIESCTIVANSAGITAGGIYFTHSDCTATNNIVYHNTAPDDTNYYNVDGDTGLAFSCVHPAVAGTGNITNDPRIVDLAGGDYRIRSSSPCRDAGINLDWMTPAFDLDGNPRIRFGAGRGIVDMGAYESDGPSGTILLVR